MKSRQRQRRPANVPPDSGADPRAILRADSGADRSQGNDTSMTVDDPRVVMAAERTLLAWVRTGLALMGLGFIVGKSQSLLAQPSGAASGTAFSLLPLMFGTALVVAGVLVTGMAAWEHARLLRRLKHGQPLEVSNSSLALVLSGLMVMVGIGLALYMLSSG